ncbi:MAG: hypothetical protein LBP53_01340 [Candidatus Peribacteria bacterium]|jgi:hypothetical protein|nr:hypothetical protein [Candidatus Peribacteria bacterium]
MVNDVQSGTDYTPTLEALQTFLPFSDIRYATRTLTTGEVMHNEQMMFDGTTISVYLGADYLLGSAMFSGLVQKKFSYEL